MTDPGFVNPKYLAPGTMVGCYRVLDQVGAGGLAAVYKVEDKGKFYALKIATYCAADLVPEEREHLDERAKREFVALGGLRHSSIVTVREFGRFPDSDGYPYLVMEFVEGMPLYDWQALHNPSLQVLARLFMELADGLDHMHSHNVVHRDLKSPNMLVLGGADEPKLKIIDFNIANPASAYTLTMAGGVLGTPSHLTPEQCDHYFHHDEHPEERFVGGPLQDMHCVGFIFYEMLAGRPPWSLGSGESDIDTMKVIRKIPPRPLASVAPDVPRELCDVVMRLLRHDPAERLTGRDLHSALGALVDRLPTAPYPSKFPPRPRHSSSVKSAPRQQSATPAPAVAGSAGSTHVEGRGPGRRAQWPVAAGAAVLIGVAGVGGGAWWAQASTPRPRLGAAGLEAPATDRPEAPPAVADMQPRTATAPKLVLPATTLGAADPAPAEPAVVPIVPAPSAAPIPLAPRKAPATKGPASEAAGARPATPAAGTPATPASSGVLVQVIRMNDPPAEAAVPPAGSSARALGAPAGLRFSGQLTADVAATVGQRVELSLPRPLYHGNSAIFPSRTRLSGAVAAVDGGKATLHFRVAVLPDGRTVNLDANAVAGDLQAGASCEVVLAAGL